MSEQAVQLFLAGLEDLRQAMDPNAGEAEVPELAFEDDEQAERASRFRTDLVSVLGDPRLADTWSPESLSTEEVFACYVFLAEGYLRAADERRHPFLRQMLVVIRDQTEEPAYILKVLPVLALAPAERWELLAHGGMVAGAVKDAKEASWPVTREQIVKTATELTQTDADPGANFHVKYLKELDLVKVTKKPRLASELQGGPEDLWIFVSLTDEGVRLLWMLGFG
jgi:hypothetical protein